MAIPKVCGIETEYGVHVTLGGDMNPTTASSLLINAYVARARAQGRLGLRGRVARRDARGFAREGSMPPEIETHLVNAVLTNGARFYVDHAHPEYSTPECSNPLELVVHDRAGELVLARARWKPRSRILPPGEEIVIYKNNSDGKGNSYGCHENYLVDRAVPFSRIVHELTAAPCDPPGLCGGGQDRRRGLRTPAQRRRSSSVNGPTSSRRRSASRRR